MLVGSISFCNTPARPRVQRAPGLPCALFSSRANEMQASGKACREIAKPCFFPSPLVGEGGAQSAPDEGYPSAETDPSPVSIALSRDRSTLSHKGRGKQSRSRNDHTAMPALHPRSPQAPTPSSSARDCRHASGDPRRCRRDNPPARYRVSPPACRPRSAPRCRR